MVCDRCKLVVKNELEKLGYSLLSVKLGEVELSKSISESEKNVIDKQLKLFGFELLNDKKSKIIEKIKNLIINQVHYLNNDSKINLSTLLSQELGLEYNYISNLFSEVEGITIEKYVIAQKIEKVKEWLFYEELSLSEIAYRLNYSSVAYLSNQFKSVTGLSPSSFKKIKDEKRKSLDDL